MILWGKRAASVLNRLDALEREMVKLITAPKEKEQQSDPVISRASEEGETWLKPRVKSQINTSS